MPKLLTVVLCTLVWAASARAQSYIGAERCKTCHEFEYDVWSRGPHAHAHKALTEDQLADAKCNGCHTITATANEPAFEGVQCERCHGPGKYYAPRYVMRDAELARAVGLIDPTPAHCQQCHTDGTPSIRTFDFASMWAKIDHGKKAREEWERARRAAEAPKAAPKATKKPQASRAP
jgi:hypothetical protein